MSIEAFLWNYHGKKPVGFDFETVREILSTDETEWLAEEGCLRVQFSDPTDSVDFFLGRDAPATNRTDGIMVARPIRHPAFLDRIFRVMKLADVMLFYSDETTPVFLQGADVSHYPTELLNSLGTPRFVDSPAGLLHQT
jgi:hypothetical protein